MIRKGPFVHCVNKILQYFDANNNAHSVAKLSALLVQNKACHFWKEMGLPKNELAMIASIRYLRLPFNFSSNFSCLYPKSAFYVDCKIKKRLFFHFASCFFIIKRFLINQTLNHF